MKSHSLYSKFTIIVLLFFIATSCEEKIKNTENFKIKEVLEKHENIEIRQGQGKLTNPLLYCYDFEVTSNREVKNLKNNIEDYISKTLEKKDAIHVSVYYRDLNNGPWMGINEDELYSPASLLKVPIMIAALKQAEDEPDFLSKKVIYQNDPKATGSFTQNIVSEEGSMEIGKEYTIEQVIENLIMNSDNISKDIIFNNLWPSNYKDVYYDLGIDIFKYGENEDFLSVVDYASYFRVLYNSTYLSKKMSEKALKLLTKTNFKKGMSAGLPKGTVLAHKFGERGFADSNLKQLHECGIVYKQKNPYLLCIMVKGADFDKMAKVISDITAISYDENSYK